MMGKRRAALARMEQVLKRAKAKKAAAAKAPVHPERDQHDQARIDKWIRDRLVDWRGACGRCRKPIVFDRAWLTVSNGEVSARFHRNCHTEWRTEREALARQAVGLAETMQ